MALMEGNDLDNKERMKTFDEKKAMEDKMITIGVVLNYVYRFINKEDGRIIYRDVYKKNDDEWFKDRMFYHEFLALNN